MGNPLKSVGIFGGTFDPIHFGHLNLAVEMLEKHSLDEVWFCPARINPHKQQEIPTATQHRLEMVRRAIAKHPKFRLLEIEMTREGPSYTIDTLHWLIQQESLKPDPAHFFLILGEDSLTGFSKWHRPEEIVKLVPLLIGSRNGVSTAIQGSELIQKAIQKGLTPTRIMEISATDVRSRLKKMQYCCHLLPMEVLDYIQAHQLYL